MYVCMLGVNYSVYLHASKTILKMAESYLNQTPITIAKQWVRNACTLENLVEGGKLKPWENPSVEKKIIMETPHERYIKIRHDVEKVERDL